MARLLRRLTLRQQLLGGFGGVMLLCLGIWLGLTYRWIQGRVDHEVATRLEFAAEKLGHLHRSGAEARSQRFGTLALEPRFRALAEVGDAETLNFAATEIRAGLASLTFGFLDSGGNLLAWDGISDRRVTDALRRQALASSGAASQQTLVVDGTAVEFTSVPLRARGQVLGFLVVGTALRQSILQDYAIAVRGRVELRSGGRLLAAGGPELRAMAEPRPIRVVVGPDLAFVIFLDVGEVSAPLRDTLSMMAMSGILVLALGAGIASVLARSLAQPISRLVETTRAVGGGDLTRRAPEAGPPEVRALAGSFNQMIASLAAHQDELRRYASTLEARVRERTTELEETNSRLAVANDELGRLSRTDGLTHLANRRWFEETLTDEWNRARRHGMAVSLLLVDIDAFKGYNDHYGHPAGDECLRTVAATLRGGVRRPGDLVARYGGEEFVVILAQTESRGARAVAEALRRAVAELGLPHAHSPVADRVTISVGVATLSPTEQGDKQTLVALADAALYEAKRSGRNRVEVAAREVLVGSC